MVFPVFSKVYALTLNVVLGLSLLMVVLPQNAEACSFNCGKTPVLRASGFVTNDDATSPYANGYSGDLPLPAIKDAENAKLIIWLHGQGNPREKEKCSAQHNLPPRSLLKINELDKTHVYYHCTAVLDPMEKKPNLPDDGVHYTYGYAMGAYTLSRRDELETVLDQFIAIGVQPSNITLSGHSAGGWTALLAAASYPEKFDRLIAFAPAFAGPRRQEKLYPWWRQIVRPEQIEMIIQPNDVKKLIFAYEDDHFNRPQELAFIGDAFPETTTLIAQKCGNGHDTHKNDCQLDNTVALMKEFIQAE